MTGLAGVNVLSPTSSIAPRWSGPSAPISEGLKVQRGTRASSNLLLSALRYAPLLFQWMV